MLVERVVRLDAIVGRRGARRDHGVTYGGEHAFVVTQQRHTEVRVCRPDQVLADRCRSDQPLRRWRSANVKVEGADAIVVHALPNVAPHQDERGTEVERSADGPEPPVAEWESEHAVKRRHVCQRRLDLCPQLRIVVETLARRAVSLGHDGQAAEVIPRRPRARRDVAVVDVAEASVTAQ